MFARFASWFYQLLYFVSWGFWVVKQISGSGAKVKQKLLFPSATVYIWWLCLGVRLVTNTKQGRHTSRPQREDSRTEMECRWVGKKNKLWWALFTVIDVFAENQCKRQKKIQKPPRELTAVSLELHAYVLLVLAGMLMQLTLIRVVLPIAAAHYLLGLALAAEGAHALGRQAVWRLDAGAAVTTGHLGAGILQSCREGHTQKQALVKKANGLLHRRTRPSSSNTSQHSALQYTRVHHKWQATLFKWLLVHF